MAEPQGPPWTPTVEVERMFKVAEKSKARFISVDRETLKGLLFDSMEFRRLHGLIHNPHTDVFIEAVKLEAIFQREHWKAEHDAGKTDADWFWLVGYLAGKALHKPQKQLHHIITTAAACLNWHVARTIGTDMRPGTAQPSLPETVGEKL